MKLTLASELRCPACCHGWLTIDRDYKITCGWPSCPDPTVVSRLLVDACARCVVDINPAGWHIEHALHCRVAGLTKCAVHAAMAAADGPPAAPGRYLARAMEDGTLDLEATA